MHLGILSVPPDAFSNNKKNATLLTETVLNKSIEKITHGER